MASLVPMIDADEHYYEPDDAFTRFLPKSFIDEGRAVRIVREEDRAMGRVFVGGKRLGFFETNPCDATGEPGALLAYFAGAGAAGDVSFSEGVTHKGLTTADDVPESRVRDARLTWLARENVEATLLFPTIAVGVEYELAASDLPALKATLTAFNRWLEEDWGFGTDSPIYGVPLLNLEDIDWAVEELERVIQRGARVVHLRPGPVAGRSPADPSHDPFFHRCAEAGVTVAFHLGNSGESEYYSAMWGENPNPPCHRFSPFQRVTSFGDRAIGDTLCALITHNLFGRVPDLRVVSIEFGSEWVRPLIKKMDRAARMCGRADWPFGPVSERPRDVFQRHIKVAPYPEDDTVGLVEYLGAGCVLAGSDWPHPEGEREPYHFADRIRDRLSEDDYRKVVHDNTAGLLGLPLLATAP